MKKLILLSTLLCTALFILPSCRTIDGLGEDIDSLELPVDLPSTQSSADALAYDATCPQVQVIEDLRTYDDFTDESSPSENVLISRARISQVNSSCHQDVRTVTVDVKVNFEGILGSQGRMAASDQPFFSYPFFVAIAKNNGKVLSKEIFAASMTYPSGSNSQTYHENLRFIIPAETVRQSARHKILIGFQLNPDQLSYNRKRLQATRKKQPAKAATSQDTYTQDFSSHSGTNPIIPVERQRINP